MTHYSANPPLVRRASKLSPQDRLWRPPPSPPRRDLAPSLPAALAAEAAQCNCNSPRLHHSSSPRLRPTIPSPSPHHREAAVPQARQVSPPPPPPDPPNPAPALDSIPSILRPQNVRSSPIPVPARDRAPLPAPPRYDDPDWQFQQGLVGSDAVSSKRHTQSDGIDVERLRAEQAERIAREERGGAGGIPGGWVE